MEASPKSVGEILDAAVRMVVRHAALLVGLAALFQVPIAFVTAPYATAAPGTEPEFGLGATALMLVAAALSLVALPAQIHAVARFAAGRDVGLDEAMGVGLRRLPAVIGTGIVLVALMLVLFAPLAAVVFGGATVLPRWAVVAGGGLFFGAWFYVGLRLIFVIQVVVLERRAGWPAVARAFALSRGHVMRVFAVTLLAAIVSSVPVAILQLLVRESPVATAALVGLAQSVASTFTTAVAVLLYLDVRARRGEAAEAEQAAASLG